jgi:hypothetical protein
MNEQTIAVLVARAALDCPCQDSTATTKQVLTWLRALAIAGYTSGYIDGMRECREINDMHRSVEQVTA